MKRPRFTIRLSFAAMTVLGVVFLLFRPINWKDELRRAAAECDHLIIEPMPGRMAPELRTTHVLGTREVQQFLDSIEIDLSASSGSCACRGDSLLHFHRGNRRLFTLSHHHGTHLRWLDGVWPSDAHLSLRSQTELREWFAQHDYHASTRY